jgi:peptide/nickel transport system permease protein/oligopeptide transport system permease protein
MKPPATALEDHARPRRERFVERFCRNRLAGIGAAMLLLFIVALLAWPVFQVNGLRPHLPLAMTSSPLGLSDAQFQSPGWQHWCGTDIHGRDLLARILYGGRVSLLVGVIGAAVSLAIGVAWGAAAGYLGGRWDAVLMRTVDILYSLPSLIFVIVIIATSEDFLQRLLTRAFALESAGLTRMLLLFAGLGAVSWLTMARIVRGQVISLKRRAFVEASRALGLGHLRIVAFHILPNTLGIIIVYATLTIPSVVLYESFLSYLGLGIQPPEASLGSLIAEGAAQINPIRMYWWMVLFPAAALIWLLLALNFVGDGLRDALEPDR